MAEMTGDISAQICRKDDSRANFNVSNYSCKTPKRWVKYPMSGNSSRSPSNISKTEEKKSLEASTGLIAEIEEEEITPEMREISKYVSDFVRTSSASITARPKYEQKTDQGSSSLLSGDLNKSLRQSI